ncbi:hypothetical protein ACIBCM_32780 [Streptomyces sp. NPDC051018]|uniref:hypothetical protein n=1 Tax=Streptomyces sp. NPDC051018 TaxID=3365639 RepID=UPI00379FCA8F
MPPSRDRHRSRLPVAAIALLGLVFTVLLALCPPPSAPSAGLSSKGAGPSSGAYGHGDERPVLTAQGQGPGCGKTGQGEDRGAQPSAPPRATAAYEPPPVPWDTHCATDTWARTATATGTAPDGRPPPLVPPSPEELSILRV